MKKYFVLGILLVSTLGCILTGGGGGGGGGGGVDPVACAAITVTSCALDQYGGHVYGTVKNICSDTSITALKIVAEVYSANGTLLDSDDEYIQNLAPGKQATFKAVMNQPASSGKTCKARADSGY